MKNPTKPADNVAFVTSSTSLAALIFISIFHWWGLTANTSAFAANGSLTMKLEDESTGTPTISRVEFFRGPAATSKREKQMPIRQTVSAGIGVVVDRDVMLELPEGPYRFRVVRGPEYRIVNGSFELEKTSLDEKTVPLPRMVDMAREGWISGDCCVAPSSSSVPLRMASEDLHVAAVLGNRTAKPIPHRDSDDKIEHEPLWIRTDAIHRNGLVFYGLEEEVAKRFPETGNSFRQIVSLTQLESESPIKIGIENPFAWELPVWLASGKANGIFVFGDWLRLDKTIYSVRKGRNEESFSLRNATQLGRYAERIYRHILDAGIDIVPLAGGGDQSAMTPIGYNRLYVSTPSQSSQDPDVQAPKAPASIAPASIAPASIAPASESEWWQGVWDGRSVATNGPLLRPLVGGKLPGHVFTGRTGEVLRIQPELNLAVRDPVEYLEVIHNNRIHYSARLREFAEAGGEIPPIMAKESGWVIIRVMTLFDDHYRATVTAPWWIEFNGQRRVSLESVQFFRDWLTQYETRLKQLPPDELAGYVPFIQAARRFWGQHDQ